MKIPQSREGPGPMSQEESLVRLLPRTRKDLFHRSNVYQSPVGSIRHAELGLVIAFGIGVVDDVGAGLVGGDLHALDVAPLEAVGFLQMPRAVDRREGVAAAAVVLEGHDIDVVTLAEVARGLAPVGTGAHRIRSEEHTSELQSH